MKKQILLLLAASAAAAQADVASVPGYSGEESSGHKGASAFFQYGIGGASSNKTTPFGKNLNGEFASDSGFRKKKSLGGMVNSLSLGMDYVSSNGLVTGLMAGYTFFSGKMKWTATEKEDGKTYAQELKARCRGYGHISTILGVQFGKNTVFARLGVSFPKFSTMFKMQEENKPGTLVSKKAKSSKGFFLAGLGYEYAVSKSFSAGVSYTLHTGKVSFAKGMLNVCEMNNVLTKKQIKSLNRRVKISEFMATLKFKMPLSR
jgi:hypothetical protein